MSWKVKLYLFSLFLLELAVFSWYFLENKEYLTEKQQAERDAIIMLADSLARVDSLEQLKKMEASELVTKTKILDSLKQTSTTLQTQLNAVEQKQEEVQTENKQVRTKNNKRIAKIYENMKPDAASRVLSRLSSDEIAGILGNVKQKKAAKIIASMNSKLAAEVTKRMMDLDTK